MRKLTSLICLVVSVLALTAPPAKALTTTEYENKIAQRINHIRSNHGLHKVRFGTCVDNCAERWARVIRNHGELFHQNMGTILKKCNAEGAGEILGFGDVSPKRMAYLWMHSPAHREIILNPSYQRIGVAAVRDDLGNWWVAVDFLYQA